MPIVTVYTTASCQMCRATKKKLEKHGVNYNTIEADAPDAHGLADAIRARAEELNVPPTMPYVTVYDIHNTLIADWFGYQPNMIIEHAAVTDMEDAA